MTLRRTGPTQYSPGYRSSPPASWPVTARCRAVASTSSRVDLELHQIAFLSRSYGGPRAAVYLQEEARMSRAARFGLCLLVVLLASSPPAAAGWDYGIGHPQPGCQPQALCG